MMDNVVIHHTPSLMVATAMRRCDDAAWTQRQENSIDQVLEWKTGRLIDITDDPFPLSQESGGADGEFGEFGNRIKVGVNKRGKLRRTSFPASMTWSKMFLYVLSAKPLRSRWSASSLKRSLRNSGP